MPRPSPFLAMILLACAEAGAPAPAPAPEEPAPRVELVETISGVTLTLLAEDGVLSYDRVQRGRFETVSRWSAEVGTTRAWVRELAAHAREIGRPYDERCAGVITLGAAERLCVDGNALRRHLRETSPPFERWDSAEVRGAFFGFSAAALRCANVAEGAHVTFEVSGEDGAPSAVNVETEASRACVTEAARAARFEGLVGAEESPVRFELEHPRELGPGVRRPPITIESNHTEGGVREHLRLVVDPDDGALWSRSWSWPTGKSVSVEARTTAPPGWAEARMRAALPGEAWCTRRLQIGDRRGCLSREAIVELARSVPSVGRWYSPPTERAIRMLTAEVLACLPDDHERAAVRLGVGADGRPEVRGYDFEFPERARPCVDRVVARARIAELPEEPLRLRMHAQRPAAPRGAGHLELPTPL